MNRVTDGGSGFFGSGKRLSRFLGRLGLEVGDADANQWTAILLAAVAVVPPFILAAIAGHALQGEVDLPFLSDVDTLVRLVIVVPVLVLASKVIGIQLGLALRYLEDTSLVPDSMRASYEDAVDRLQRRANSTGYIAALFVIAVAGSILLYVVFASGLRDLGLTTWAMSDGNDGLSPAGWWYVFVSRPVVAFLILLWAWRYVSWSRFQLDLSRCELRLLPGHPDRAGGRPSALCVRRRRGSRARENT